MKKFTLIELMVVLAIIGILLSLLFPALGKARKLAISTNCVSNMKQIHVAQTIWSGDNDNYMMNALNGNIYWWRDIAPYAGYTITGNGPYDLDLDRFSSSNVFKCPSTTLSKNLNWQWTKYGYALYAGNTDDEMVGRAIADPVKSTLVSDPSYALMLMDYDRWKNGNGAWDRDVRREHDGKTNTIFVDGHARANVREKQQIQKPSNLGYWLSWSHNSGQ